MNDLVEKVADAVLYEGHMLYPYRPSSVKNQQPFTFGTLDPGESIRIECLVEGESPKIEVTVRTVGQAFSLPSDQLSFLPLADRLHKLRVLFTNQTKAPLISTQAILHVQNGAFLSLTDPPAELREAAAQCQNTGVWPVLVGEPGSRDYMLASRIILPDYPEIAPESPGDLFDGTEIDEILTLRILTMTDAEKEEMRNTDERTRRILERTESLAPEQLMKLHGTLRNPHGIPVKL